ncbi:hypothetical protein TNCV_785441 [Trichonephila clavipes]|nr:hypothetical protein TNCV_785441 [Trichonephila clavipes]
MINSTSFSLSLNTVKAKPDCYIDRYGNNGVVASIIQLGLRAHLWCGETSSSVVFGRSLNLQDIMPKV